MDTNEVRMIVATDTNDFPHEVLRVALNKYMEKYIGAEVTAEALEEMQKEISKFLNRMVRTEVEVTLHYTSTAPETLNAEFSLHHTLR